MSEWIVFDPLDCDVFTFSTEAEATAHAEHLIETYLDDGHWAEEVVDIYVAQRTHVVQRRVVAARSELGDEAFEELTGDTDSNDEWWEHHLVPVSYPKSDAVEPSERAVKAES